MNAAEFSIPQVAEKRQQVDANVWTKDETVEGYLRMEQMLRAKHKLFEQVSSYLPEANGGEVLFDLGCGPMTFVPYAMSKGYRVLGLDHSAPFLNHAKSTLGDSEDVVGIARGDITAPLPLASNSVDAIVSVNVLYHFADQQLLGDESHIGILKEARRVLKKGGVLVMTNPMPEASISGILTEEVSLRRKEGMGLMRAMTSLAGDIIAHRNFMKVQSEVQREATKKGITGWQLMLSRAGFTPNGHTRGYGGSASIVTGYKNDK
jgi:SAM-dependent methyltransferase